MKTIFLSLMTMFAFSGAAFAQSGAEKLMNNLIEKREINVEGHNCSLQLFLSDSNAIVGKVTKYSKQDGNSYVNAHAFNRYGDLVVEGNKFIIDMNVSWKYRNRISVTTDSHGNPLKVSSTSRMNEFWPFRINCDLK